MADIVIYTRQLCGFCSAAKKLLSHKGVSYTEHDATFSPELRKQMTQESNGAATFPQIFINGDHIGGCDDLMALEQADKLDSLLNV